MMCFSCLLKQATLKLSGLKQQFLISRDGVGWINQTGRFCLHSDYVGGCIQPGPQLGLEHLRCFHSRLDLSRGWLGLTTSSAIVQYSTLSFFTQELEPTRAKAVSPGLVKSGISAASLPLHCAGQKQVTGLVQIPRLGKQAPPLGGASGLQVQEWKMCQQPSLQTAYVRRDGQRSKMIPKRTKKQGGVEPIILVPRMQCLCQISAIFSIQSLQLSITCPYRKRIVLEKGMLPAFPDGPPRIEQPVGTIFQGPAPN